MSKTARQTALDLLARREHSARELSDKLSLRGYTPEDIATTLDALCRERLQSDARFTECYIAARSAKGYGPLRIRQELRARGVDATMIEEALKIADNDWLLAIRRVFHKRFKNAMPNTHEDRATFMRFFLHRGFSNDHIATLYQSDTDHG